MVYKEITETAERKVVYPNKFVALPHLTNAPFPSKDHDQWVRDNWWMVDYSVFMADKEYAMKLAEDLCAAFSESPNHPNIPEIVKKLRALRVKDQCERTTLDIWMHSAYQLASYCSDIYVKKAILECLAKYNGSILEAMCGHDSYLEDKDGRIITALDYCEISLLRYPYPSRRRILCDLNQISDETRLNFFERGQFDCISICFGYKYPRSISRLVREFSRILKPGGKLSFVENPESGYTRCVKRQFRKVRVCNNLLLNGLEL